jgi:hypothetical protein
MKVRYLLFVVAEGARFRRYLAEKIDVGGRPADIIRMTAALTGTAVPYNSSSHQWTTSSGCPFHLPVIGLSIKVLMALVTAISLRNV